MTGPRLLTTYLLVFIILPAIILGVKVTLNPPTVPITQEYVNGIPGACRRVSQTFDQYNECVGRETEIAAKLFRTN
jgi:hypothetical protein